MARNHKFWKWRNQRLNLVTENVKYQHGAESGVKVLHVGKCQDRDAKELNLQLTFLSALFLSLS